MSPLLSHRAPRGMAIVVTLVVLVLLAVMGVAFCHQISIESSAADTVAQKAQADLIARSGLDHVLSELRIDAERQPGWDSADEPWHAAFVPDKSNPDAGADVDGIPGAKDARWIPVKDYRGLLIGRYAIMIEDESAKINVNMASTLSPKMQNQGCGTYEIMLTDGKGAGLPVSIKCAKNILRHRYGRDLRPGQANVDDNLTASSYAHDLIDNDGNGIIDEEGEGTDEPEEYNPSFPQWDDRAFACISEVGRSNPKGNPFSPLALRMLKKFGTTQSRCTDMYWDRRDNAMRNQVNINVATRRQMSRLFRRANAESQFEADSRNMRKIVANVLDYRDENRVLTTAGGEYGVEAVCFNEVMANDASFTVRADRNDSSYLDHNMVHRFGWWYELFDHHEYDKKIKRCDPGWEIEEVGRPGGSSAPFVQNGERVTVRRTTTVKLNDFPETALGNEFDRAFRTFTKLRKKFIGGDWPVNMWKNSWLMVYRGKTNDYYNSYVAYPIVGNTKDELTVGYDNSAANTYEFLYTQGTSTNSEIVNSVWINNLWRRTPGGLVTVFPEVTESFYFPTDVFDETVKMPRGLYYSVFIAENNLPGTVRTGSPMYDKFSHVYVMEPWEERKDAGGDPPSPSQLPWKGFNPNLDVDDNPNAYSSTRMLEIHQSDLKGTSMILPGDVEKAWLLRTPYRDGEPIRARRVENEDYIDVTVSTCRKTGYGLIGGYNARRVKTAYENKNAVQYVHFMRPDILEVINISDHPVCLRNWRVVINTGSYADQVGIIDSAMHYSKARSGRYDNPSPVIEPGEYFYLTNHRRIFDFEYGSPKNGTWGSSASEAYPCYELPDELWGVRYEVQNIRGGNKIVCKGANWKKDQMKYEMTEWHCRTDRPTQNSPVGIRKTIEGNGRNYLYMGSANIVSLKKGDDVLILGMPREGGFLSMTLRNEYNQIAARTITYGSTKLSEIGYSSEKMDPTHYTWVKCRRPTLGGTKRAARNRAYPGDEQYKKPYVKDNRLVSVGELQKVRGARDWENIGSARGGGGNTAALKSLSKYLTVSGMRLDPEEPGVHVEGWKPAFGVASASSLKAISSETNRWEPGIWNNHTLSILSGRQKGERFSIDESTERSIRVTGYSHPGGEQLSALKGDKFCVGPGYSTPSFYTRKSGEAGVWEWQNKGLSKGRYGMYIFGLNDSIKTTEYLEENHNAELEVLLFNFETRQYDSMPLEDPEAAAARESFYRVVGRKGFSRCGKSDGVYCGMILPRHISPSGGIRLKLVAHGLNDSDCSGFAWFDYAYLTPGCVDGKININTASERVLRALTGVSPKLAHNIHARRGLEKRGKKKGRQKRSGRGCYKDIADVLDIDGMTPEVFSRICNQITTRSDQFRVQVVAQSVQDVNNNGIFDGHDNILGRSKLDALVDRHEVTEDSSGTKQFKIQYN